MKSNHNQKINFNYNTFALLGIRDCDGELNGVDKMVGYMKKT